MNKRASNGTVGCPFRPEKEKSMSTTAALKPIGFACPKCKRPLRPADNALHCSECNRAYPIVSGIPDFISGDAEPDVAPVLRMARKVDLLAPIYESRLWSQLLLNLAGAGAHSLGSIASFHAETLGGVTGSVLDVACGTATYTRRIASPSRNVYGIDISMGMLRKGMAYVARDGVPGVHLARARVEELPFEDAVFDGGVCSGSLHLFLDTVLALREIARTMKAGAPLSVQTFVAGGRSAIMRLLGRRRDVQAFEISELQQYLTEAGFGEFQPQMDGIFLTFSARKAARA
jgi:ubiquinone/menaquinone biosynthesis C-methylase UbiE